jgi:hypothetical protein
MKLKMPDGSEVEATPMEFKTVEENWNSYELHDGTVLRLKTTPIKIFQLEAKDPITGEHHYYVQHNTVVAVSELREVRSTK